MKVQSGWGNLSAGGKWGQRTKTSIKKTPLPLPPPPMSDIPKKLIDGPKADNLPLELPNILTSLMGWKVVFFVQNLEKCRCFFNF